MKSIYWLLLLATLCLPLFPGCGTGANSGPPEEYAPLPPADALRTQKSETTAASDVAADGADDRQESTSD